MQQRSVFSTELPGGDQISARYAQLGAQMAAWQLPEELVQLGYLLGQVERGQVQPEQLVAHLGAEAAAVAAALTALREGVPRPALQNMEQPWKLFMLTYLHPSAGLLKICELCMQLRQSQEVGAGIDTETIGAAANICARLGLYDLRAELRDAQARLADPHLVRRAQELLERTRPLRTQIFESLRYELDHLLRTQGIAAQIERRVLPLYRAVDDGLESTRDSFTRTDLIVVLAEHIADCYRALGAINHRYPVAGSKLRDYIGGPKENGYQAIHTMVEYSAADRTTLVEIRIATPAMDHYNRQGYLAFLAGAAYNGRQPLWWSNRQRWLEAYAGRSNELFVFTPMGEAVFLPREATVLDFAVRVHSDLGVYCCGARVNGSRTSPGERLVAGDICEVLIDEHGAPIDQRLLNLASTTTAKSRIRRALQKGHDGAMRGQQIFNALLAARFEEQEIQASASSVEQLLAGICRSRNYQSVEAFYRAVARGEAAPDRAVGTLVEHLLLPRLSFEAVPLAVRARARHLRLALCCRPRPSQPAVATPVHGGYQLKVHRPGCTHLGAPAYALAWHPLEQQAQAAEVLYESWDRPGLIYQITRTISEIGSVNIRSFNAEVPEPSLARIRFSFEATSPEVVEQVRQALVALPEQRHVELRIVRVIDQGLHIAEPLDNPYGPHPVGRWPLFVGRSGEVKRMLALLGSRNGANHILIRGPKRIGKSSLLLHLSRHHLTNFRVPSLLDLQSLPNTELRFPRLLNKIAELLGQQVGQRNRALLPTPAAFEQDPIGTFSAFLDALRNHGDSERFVVLIDELGVVLSRLQGSELQAEFFDQWRALLNNEQVYRHLAFVVALPDYSVTRVAAASSAAQPAARIGELGYSVRLSLLDEADARDLISAPIKAYLVYRPADLDLLVSATGGHPYYIHLVCGHIVTAFQTRWRSMGGRPYERREITAEEVQAALEAVLAHEDAFYHVLADNSPGTSAVLQALAALTPHERTVSRVRLRTRLRRFDQAYDDSTITWALEERPDLLYAAEGRVGIRVGLVARWLRHHG